MKIAIMVAMDKELQLVRDLLTNPEETEIGGLRFVAGQIGKHEVILSKCGIGKVNAAINAYKLVSTASPDMVLNTGVAGGAGLPVGTLLVADRMAYADVWCGPSTVFGEADGCPLFFTAGKAVVDAAKPMAASGDAVFGLICTTDMFITKAEEISAIRSHFPDVAAVDMESAAIAQACYLAGVPLGVIRVVSDTPGAGENIAQYESFWADAPQKTFRALKTIIEAI